MIKEKIILSTFSYYIDYRSCQFSAAPVLSLSPIRRRARERAREIYFILNAHYYFTRRRTTMVIPRQIITGFRFAPEFRLFFRVSAVLWRRLASAMGRLTINVAPVIKSREGNFIAATMHRRNCCAAIPKINHTRPFNHFDDINFENIAAIINDFFAYIRLKIRAWKKSISLNFRIYLSVLFSLTDTLLANWYDI